MKTGIDILKQSLENALKQDIKEHFNSTTDYVLKNTEVELDTKSIDDILEQVWVITVEDYGLKRGSEKEELYGQVFDDMELELFNKIKWYLYENK